MAVPKAFTKSTTRSKNQSALAGGYSRSTTPVKVKKTSAQMPSQIRNFDKVINFYFIVDMQITKA